VRFKERLDGFFSPTEKAKQNPGVLNHLDIIRSGFLQILQILESRLVFSGAVVVEGQQLPGIDRGLALGLLLIHELPLTPDRFGEVALTMRLFAFLTESRRWR
jgi:hypothetical protein